MILRKKNNLNNYLLSLEKLRVIEKWNISVTVEDARGVKGLIRWQGVNNGAAAITNVDNVTMLPMLPMLAIITNVDTRYKKSFPTHHNHPSHPPINPSLIPFNVKYSQHPSQICNYSQLLIKNESEFKVQICMSVINIWLCGAIKKYLLLANMQKSKS